jgi:hypothetical protein
MFVRAAAASSAAAGPTRDADVPDMISLSI